MPNFPMYSASSRLQVGGSAASMSPMSIGRPNLLSPASLQYRRAEAPFYTAQIDQVGPLIRNQSINQFGSVLVDVAANLADRRAKLDAEEKTQAFYERLQAMELEFYQLSGKEAVDGYEKFAEQVNKLESKTLDEVSNHSKIYLSRSLRNLKNASLNSATRFTAAQYGIADKKAMDQQLTRTSDQLKDLVYETDPKKIKEFIETSLDSINFPSASAKQETIDSLYGQLFKFQADSVVIPGENSSDTTLYQRLNALQDRLKAYRPEISMNQYIKFNEAVMSASLAVTREVDRRDVERKKAVKNLSNAMVNDIYKSLNNNDPYPEATIKAGIEAGYLTEKNRYALKRLFDQREKEGVSGSDRTKEQTAAYLNYISRIVTNEPFEVIQKDLLTDIDSDAIRPSDAIAISQKASSSYDSLYKTALRRGKERGDLLIMTSGPLASIRASEETELYGEYVDELTSRLDELQATGSLSHAEVDKVLDNLREKYGAEVQWERMSFLPTVDRSIAHPKNFSELLRAMEDINSRTDLTLENKMRALELKDRYEKVLELKEQFKK